MAQCLNLLSYPKNLTSFHLNLCHWQHWFPSVVVQLNTVHMGIQLRVPFVLLTYICCCQQRKYSICCHANAPMHFFHIVIMLKHFIMLILARLFYSAIPFHLKNLMAKWCCQQQNIPRSAHKVSDILSHFK